MKEPAGLVNEDGRWNKREALLNQLLREYLLGIVEMAEDVPAPKSRTPEPDKLAQALDFYLKGNK